MNSTPWGEEGTNQDEIDRLKTTAGQGIDEGGDASSPMTRLAAPSSPPARSVEGPAETGGSPVVTT
jgi:hypothetical protein